MSIQRELLYISDNNITEIIFDMKENLTNFVKGDILIHNENKYKVLTDVKKVKVSSLKKTEKVIYNKLPNKKELNYMIRVLAL
tara:strand:- start:296 stop:544 length:249 start_codon:yes stop_codon:yes gene_type:complete